MKLLILLSLIFSLHVSAQTVDTAHINQHLKSIINTEKPRNYRNMESLNFVATYIYDNFKQYADTVYFQPYEVEGKTYKNVVAIFGVEFSKTVVVGAHYDVCGEQDGADDNATGLVGLLELAKLLKGQVINHRIELVAYTLEEPPFFRSENMGSYIHAKSLSENETNVYGMFCLEMIGYFDDSKKSQDYPIGILSMIYGNKGNYITLVNKLTKGKFSRKFNRQFKKHKQVRTKKFTAPASLPGIDFSDHLNYWAFGYSALMITDTAFYRNKNYHQTTDTLETLDLVRMGKVIETVFLTLTNLR
ncbi:MAG: M28 family peptidase [Crocinitomicaceae bacterium]